MGSWLGSCGLHLCPSQLHVGPVMDLETFSSAEPGQSHPDSFLAWSLKSGNGGGRRRGGQGARTEEASQGTEEAAAWVEEGSALALYHLSIGLLSEYLDL